MNIKKLTVREFARAVKLGHGRAILHVLHHGDKGMEKIIEQALLKSYVYDWQIEGSRAGWLMSLLQATGRSQFYAGRMLEQSGGGNFEADDLAQQLLVASRLFEIGCHKMGEVAFSKYKQILMQSPHRASSGSELIDLAGYRGLEFAARAMVASGIELDSWDCWVILERMEDLDGSADGEERLKKLAASEPDISKFLEAAHKHKKDSGTPHVPRPRVDFAQFLNMVERREHYPSGRYYQTIGRRFDEVEIGRAYDLLVESEDPWLQLSCLRLFQARKLPEAHPKIVTFLRSSDKHLASAACSALELVKCEEVRTVALEWLHSREQKRIVKGLQLLKANFESGDEEIIFKILPLLKDSFQLHSAGMTVQEILADIDFPRAGELLLWFYEHGPDSFCRYHFFKMLVELDQCPNELIYEAQWDCGQRTQLLAREIIYSKESPIEVQYKQ
jgi:hypothetical protein